ncbi:PAS domain-containing protein [Dongia rigui]|uniref:PAS domain-containing protein n=1 Tax=Dongia rigui TaxID=940149 RepID=A0ABU5DWF8_9PROT|nr:PAS domain-containing protein [Dongia rigui]MDY0870916.1 PAS domain-containing protein [Dongia rigui]
MRALPAGVAQFADVAQARMPSTQRLFHYWHESRRNGVPLQRGEIDPLALRDILPLLLLGDIEPEPFRVLFRLIGTGVADFSRQDFSGQYLDELVYSARDSIDWSVCYRFVHAAHTGIVGTNALHFADGRITSYEFAIFPLARGDDPAGSFIAIEAYDDFDRLVIPDLRPVQRR